MKKIVTPGRGIRLNGDAEADGVIFSVTHPADPFGFLKSTILSTVNDKDEINSSAVMDFGSYTTRISERICKLSHYSNIVLIILSIVVFIGSLACAGFGAPSWLVECLTSLFIILFSAIWLSQPIGIFVAKLFGDKDIKSFTQFLSAKNAVLNAFYDLGKTPSIEEAKQYSIYEADSKYVKNAFLATLLLCISILHPLSSWKYFVAVIIVGLVVSKLENENKLFFWQSLITSKPEDIHYEAAVTALEKCLNFRDSVQVKFTVIEAPEDFKPNFSEKKCAGCEHYDFCKGIVTSAADAEKAEIPD